MEIENANIAKTFAFIDSGTRLVALIVDRTLDRRICADRVQGRRTRIERPREQAHIIVMTKFSFHKRFLLFAGNLLNRQ